MLALSLPRASVPFRTAIHAPTLPYAHASYELLKNLLSSIQGLRIELRVILRKRKEKKKRKKEVACECLYTDIPVPIQGHMRDVRHARFFSSKESSVDMPA